MADTESLRHITHSRAPLSTWLGVVLLFALFGVIVMAIIGPMPRGSDYEETRAKKRIENLKTAREDAEKTLNTYAWVDKNKGVVRIPISRAMELTVADLAQKKPAPAGPIATPPAQASPAGAASRAASPAPAASKPGGTQATVSPSASSPGGSPSPPSRTAASPSTQAPASPSPAAQSSPAAGSPRPASPAPAKSP